jgi:hypothetical protein
MLMWPRLWILIRFRPWVLAALVLLAGCSAKGRIDSAAIGLASTAQSSGVRFDNIGALAQSSESRFEAAGDLDGVAEQQQIRSEAAAGADDQQDIASMASDIRTSLHGVEDIVPWWASLLGRLAIAAIIVAVLILLWKSGALDFIRRIFWAMGLLIPKKVKAEALMDVKALADEDEVTLSEAVAAKRARDPAYCAAFKQAKRKHT